MQYADDTRCPGCRAVLGGLSHCAVCGIDLRAPELVDVWERLARADELLDRVRERVRAAVVPPPPAQVAPPVVAPPVAPPPLIPPVTAPPPAAGGFSAGSVLLGLGAVLLVAAAFVFVSFAWSALGIGGRAAILALLTVVVGGVGAWSLQRGLRGSSEAVWLVFAGFVTADWFAACGLGLFGLDALSGWQVAVPWWLMLGLTAVAVGVAARRTVASTLVGLDVAAGVAWAAVVASASHALLEADLRLFWVMALTTAVGGLLVWCAVQAGHRIAALVVAVVTSGTAVTAVVSALVEAIEHREPAAYLGEAHGLPLLLITVSVACAAAWRPARTAAVAGAVVLLALLVALPLAEAWDGQAWFVWLAGLLLAVAAARLAGAAGRDEVGTGLLGATAALAAVVAMTWVTGLAALVQTVVLGLDEGASDTPWSRRPLGGDVAGLDAWATVVGGTALACVLLAVSGWPELRSRTASHRGTVRQGVVAAGLTAVLTAIAVMADLGAPLLLTTVVVLVTGCLVMVTAVWTGRHWLLVGLALVAVAPVLVVPTWTGLTAAGAVSGLVALIAAPLVSWIVARHVAAAVGLGWLLGAVLLLLTHPQIDADDRLVVTVMLGLGLLVGVVGTTLRRWPTSPSLTVEIVGAGTAGLALATGLGEGDLAWSAAWLTAVGVVTSATGLLAPARSFLRWVGAACLGLAWILRLVAWDVTTVEAYTVPFAVVGLAVGVWAMRRDAALRTAVTLLAPLALGVVPSALVALGDPVSWRALVVGLVAAGLVALGLAARWQAPFVVGSLVLLVLGLVEIAPYGLALPRWMLLAAAGLVLLVGGITWEKRVRDGRAVVRFVGAMR